MDVGNGKALHEVMYQMLASNKLVEDENVIGKQSTSIKVDKDVKDPNKETIDTANIIKSAPTREDPNKSKEKLEDENVDGIADGILVVTDPEITSEEFEEVADELQGIVDNAEAGEVPFTDKYEGDYILSCPICGGTFVSDTLLDSGEDACPICCKVPDAFVVNGKIEDSESVVGKEDVQDDIEHEENLEEPEGEEEQPMDMPEEQPLEDGEKENPMRKESKEISGNVVTENKKLEEDEYEDYMEQEKALAEDYKARIMKQVTPEIKTAFNDLKYLLDRGNNLIEVDGFYFPKIAVAMVKGIGDLSHHLNSYMDLTISNILNMVDDNDTVEDAISELFEEYKVNSAYSWADNFISVLGKLDSSSYEDRDDEDYEETEVYEESKKITEEEQGEYKEKVLKSITPEVETSFNNLKDILDEGEHLIEVDGFYFPEKAVAAVEGTSKSYHLNSNMDLTVSNILNMVDDNDTVEDAINELFEEYKVNSAYSWADNFIVALSNTDFSSYEDSGKWEIYDWDYSEDGTDTIEGAGRLRNQEFTFEVRFTDEAIEIDFYDFDTCEEIDISDESLCGFIMNLGNME